MSASDTYAAWLAEDPDAETRAELAELIERAEAGDEDAHADLADRFDGTLQFGTAGLRGALGAGPNRMNRVVVLRAAAGLAAYLAQDVDPHGEYGGGPVVIGYDARHNSEVFARDTAEVMTGAGIEAVLLPRPLPTPALAYAIGDLGARAGVMVTASHNPPQDNGYKVYLADGSQIVPPADHDIAARISAVGPVGEIPRGADWSYAEEALVERYLACVAETVEAGPRDLRIVYTPMHGVGGRPMLDILARAGFAEPAVVAEQFEPDPDFPTVSFPNPEEPGAMDLALALAAATGADLVLANDPDADRCAAAVPVRGTDRGTERGAEGGWRMLRGDEVGALLGHALLERGVRGTYACSIVSSSLLGRLAAARSQPYVETLTGFKWIGRLPGLVFGYEEALGYCVDPAHVKDKDGLSAALALADLAARTKAEGRTLVDVLDDIAREHGLHATDQLSVRVADLGLIDAAMDRLRTTPPDSFGGRTVTSAEDLADGSEETTGLPPTDGLRYRLEGDARVIVRPSGTEPKLKCYLEVVVPVSDSVGAARSAAREQLDALRTDVAAALGLE